MDRGALLGSRTVAPGLGTAARLEWAGPRLPVFVLDKLIGAIEPNEFEIEALEFAFVSFRREVFALKRYKQLADKVGIISAARSTLQQRLQ